MWYGKTDIDKFNEALKTMKTLQKNIKNEVLLDILSVKNTNIKNINNNMFLINSSNLSLVSWSPEYYNVEQQARRIVSQLENYDDILKIRSKISEYISTEKIVMSPTFKIQINEKLIEKLKEIKEKLNELET